jgi:translation initiation factor IF-3
VDIDTALRMADEVGLDLVEIAPDAVPPVCKIMDFGKYKYEIAQKAREARQNQTHIVVKEVRMRPKIESHDYETKRSHIEKFLRGGDKVKITMQFRGREQTRPELGYRLLQRLAEDVAEFGFVEFAPKQEGRNMTMVLGPTKRKTEAVAEQKAARKAKAAAEAAE